MPRVHRRRLLRPCVAAVAAALLLQPPRALVAQAPAPAPAVAGQTAAGQAPTGQAGNAEAVLEQYIAALGGRTALARVRTVEAAFERTQFGIRSTSYRVEDRPTRRYYQRVDSPDGVQESGYDGERLWQKRAAFQGYLPEDDLQARIFRQREPELYEYRERGRTYVRLPDEVVADTTYVVLQGTQRQPIGGEIPVRFYFDPVTRLLRRKTIGPVALVTQTFGDYRPVAGVLVPFVTTTTQPQGTTVIRTVSERRDVPVPDSVFRYRPGAPPLPIPGPRSTAIPTPTAVADPAAGGRRSSAAPPPVAGLTPAPATTTPSSRRVPEPDDRSDDGSLAPLVLSDSVRRATFEYVWRTVRDTYWDTTFGGVDWAAVRERYRPPALAEPRSDRFHAVLARMVGELHQSHFHVRGPEAVVTEGTAAADLARRPTAHPGFDLRWVERALLVVGVDSGSPAARAGVRPGDVVERIDGRAPDALYAAWRAANPDFELRRVSRVRAAEDALRGPAGSRVHVDVRGAAGRTAPLELERQAPPLGLPRPFTFAWRRLAPDAGYVRFSVFYNDAVERFRAALDSLRDTRGLVIDLRGNPGGVGAMARVMASALCADSGSLGTTRFRYETQRYTFPGGGSGAYRGRVAVLVDSHSGSTSELFAVGLQELGRARVVGDTSAGAVLPSTLDLLPSGGGLQHPVGDFRSPRGQVLEGRGVVPDLAALPTREALLAGRDLPLERALRYARDGA